MRNLSNKFLLVSICLCAFTQIQSNTFISNIFKTIQILTKFKRKKAIVRPYHTSTPSDFSGKTELLFSPQDNIASNLITLINEENESIKIAMFIFTHDGIAKNLVHAVRRGVKVEVIIDKSCSTIKNNKISYLKDNGIDVLIYNNPSSYMHEKFAVFGSKKQVCFGSFNFTARANKTNRENFAFTNHKKMIQRLQEEFSRLKSLLTFFS